MRLLIVDDGPYIVEYVKHLLDWGKIGITDVQTTTNSLEAKRILETSSIDILLTDIRMPELSGVDLLKFLHERQSRCKVIFLSGYSDFEYTRSAIRFGAADYLLKPVDKDEMERTVLRAVQAAERDRPAPAADGPEPDGIGMLLAALADNAALNERFAPLMQARAAEPFVFVGGSPDRIAAAAIAPAPAAGEENGTLPHSAPFHLHEKNTARSEFMRFYYAEKVSLADSVFLRGLQKKWAAEPKEWAPRHKFVQKLFLDCQSRSQQVLFLVEWIARLYSESGELSAASIAAWLVRPSDDPRAVFAEVLAAASPPEHSERAPGHDIVRVVQAHIRGHLDKPLNLDEIGALVHLHPVYLSKFYKQETGENLSGFLLAERMKKAAQLLLESNLHIVDISQLVGYKKTQHFIKLFKEQFGITPYQYRRTSVK